MLRKLLKHEFRATARVMGPLFLVMLVLSLAANLSLRFLLDSSSFFPNLIGGILIVAFSLGLVALIIMSIVLTVNRFRTNLLGDEGYVMLTLPVSSHQLIWSKIIVSTVWFVATFFVECLAGIICAFDLRVLREIFSSEFFHELARAIGIAVDRLGLNLPVMGLEILILSFLCCAVVCLGFYAAMAIGYSFARHKMALSVGFFFLLQFASQILLAMVIRVLDNSSLYNWMYDVSMNGMDGMGAFHMMMGIGIVITLGMGAIYYAITAVMLKKRLNLE